MPLIDLATSGFILFLVIVQEKDVSRWRRSREPSSFEGTATKSAIKHISKNRSKFSKIPDYTGRAHVIRDVKYSIP